MNRIQPLSESNASEDCPDSDLNPELPAANGTATATPGTAPPAVPKRAASRRSRFLEQVYYWVLSRS
jgi:hypothetical protein